MDHLSLLSTVIHRNASGIYHLYHVLLLSRNEVCRREFTRLSRSLENFDAIRRPWKALALQKWLSEYFLLLINLVERQKCLYLYHRLLSMGHNVPSELRYDEKVLHSKISRIANLSSDICNLVLHCDHFGPRKLSDFVNDLKDEVAGFKFLMETQYALEESFWPQALSAEGKDETFLILTKMAIDIRNVDPIIGELCGASMLYTAGHMNKMACSNNDVCDLPWCGSRTCKELLKTLPYVIKVVPFMHQISRVMHYRIMISSLSSADDSLDLLGKYNQQIGPYSGCWGWRWKNSINRIFHKNLTSIRITSELRASSRSIPCDEYSRVPYSRKQKKCGDKMAYHFMPLDSFGDTSTSSKSKSPISPRNTFVVEIMPLPWNKFNYSFLTSSRICPTNDVTPSSIVIAAKNEFSPRSPSSTATNSYRTGSTDSVAA